MSRYIIIVLLLCTLQAGNTKAQTQKPGKKPTTHKPAKPASMPSIESLLSMTDTAAYAAIKKIDVQIEQKDRQIAQLKASQKNPSTELSLESREKELLENESALYQLYSDREKLVLKKKELRRRSMQQTVMSKPTGKK